MPGQVFTALLLLTGVVGLGLPLSGLAAERLQVNVPTRAALVPLGGLAALGLLTLVAGHLWLLGPWIPYAAAAAGLACVVLGWRSARAVALTTWRSMWAQARAHPVPSTVLVLALLLALVATAVPPWRTDEIQYHWPAPLAWAEAGGWNDSPYRHVNAFPFMEIVYTAAAVQQGYLAAHLLQLTSLVALGLASAGVARSLGVRGTAPTAAAAMIMPVAWDGAYVAYNDTVVGAFGVAAVAALLGSGSLRARTAVAAALLAVAISIKPTAVVAAGSAGLVLLLEFRRKGSSWRESFAAALPSWIALGASAVATVAFWSVRQWLITGNLIDPTLTGPPSADALTRLPSTTQQLLAPLMPFVSGVVGAQEPWGGRTSLVVQIFLVPALAYVAWRRGDVERRFTTAAVPAWAHWVVLGVANVRTRFHILSWALLVVAVRVAAEDASARHPRWARWIETVWSLALVLAAVDVSLEMVRAISRL